MNVSIFTATVLYVPVCAALEYFCQNMGLLLLILLFSPALIIAALLTWAALRVWWHNKSVQRDDRRRDAAKHDGCGRLLPPMDEGLCNGCGRVLRGVYHLPDGRRLCPGCYKP